MRLSISSHPALLVTMFSAIHASRLASKSEIPVNVYDLDPLQTCKRRDVQLVESDNMVYMYGGQSWVKNGTEDPFQITNHYLRIADFTSARDLSDGSIISAISIPGNITIFQQGAFWVDTKKIYFVGGAVNDEPWLSRDGQFLPSNYSAFRGGTVFSYDVEKDDWTSEPALQPSSGASVTDSFCCGAFSYNSNFGKAYFFSGTNGAGARKLDPDTEPGYVGRTNEETVGNGNLLTFNITTFKWTNDTTDAQLTTTGTENGRLVFLPGTTSSSGGLAVALGGQRKDSGEMESLRKVLIFDSATGLWYSQATTADDGDFPASRWNFCAVAASAPDSSSHSLYMYGGTSSQADPEAYSDIWILSIPFFHWIRVDIKSVPKKALGCTTIADRYMVTYGGMQVGQFKEGDEDDCDQEYHGLRLFDLSSLAWTNKYEGPASTPNAFMIPKLVYDIIGGDEKGSATKSAPSAGFETPALKTLFQKPSQPTTSPTGTDQPPNKHDDDSKTSTNGGAIAGGVVGGVAGVVVIVLAIFCFRKRRKQSSRRTAYQSTPYELDGRSRNQLDDNGQIPKRVFEMSDRQPEPPQEMYAGHTSLLSSSASPAGQHVSTHT